MLLRSRTPRLRLSLEVHSLLMVVRWFLPTVIVPWLITSIFHLLSRLLESLRISHDMHERVQRMHSHG